MSKTFLIVAIIVIAVLLVSFAVMVCTSKPPPKAAIAKGFILGQGENVNLTDVYAGSSNYVEITVVNSAERTRNIILAIAPTTADSIREQLPEKYYSWFAIQPSSFVLNRGGMQLVTVAVEVPEDADVPAGIQRFQILVQEVDSAGYVKSSIASNWLVSFKEVEPTEPIEFVPEPKYEP